MATRMMATIAGPLDRDPDIRYSREGEATTTLAVHDATAGHVEVIVRGYMAENVALTFVRGHRVVAVGTAETTVYTAEDGRTMTVSEFLAEEVAGSVRTAVLDVHNVARQVAEVTA